MNALFHDHQETGYDNARRSVVQALVGHYDLERQLVTE